MVNRKKKASIVNFTTGPGFKVRLRGKILAKGKTSLYLDYYIGYSKTSEGKVTTKRKTEYLKIYLQSNPRSQEERQSNKANLSIAQKIRSQKESDLLHNEVGLTSPHKKKTNFFDFCDQYEKGYPKKDIRMIAAAIRLFKEFTGEDYILPKHMDEEMIEDFRDSLLSRFNGETPYSYFARFKKILRAATKDGLFTVSPAAEITCSKPEGITKAILTPDEIIGLSKAKCNNNETKKAFLFCLNTGLRFVDVKDLKHKHIENNQVKKSQLKVGKPVYIDLNANARKLVGEVKKSGDLVFKLPSYTACRNSLTKWSQNAGIEKNITWHSARHSFATILLMNNNNIKTVSNLLGHSKLEHTQKYTHAVDELKRKAVEGLPEIEM